MCFCRGGGEGTTDENDDDDDGADDDDAAVDAIVRDAKNRAAHAPQVGGATSFDRDTVTTKDNMIFWATGAQKGADLTYQPSF